LSLNSDPSTCFYIFLSLGEVDDVLIVKYGLANLLACFSSKENSLKDAKGALEADAGFLQWLSSLLILHPDYVIKEKAATTFLGFFGVESVKSEDSQAFFIFFLKSMLGLLQVAEEHPFATSEYFRLLESQFVYSDRFSHTVPFLVEITHPPLRSHRTYLSLTLPTEVINTTTLTDDLVSRIFSHPVTEVFFFFFLLLLLFHSMNARIHPTPTTQDFLSETEDHTLIGKYNILRRIIAARAPLKLKTIP